jgi:hypothetical protein
VDVKSRESLWSGSALIVSGTWFIYQAAQLPDLSLVPNDPMNPGTLPTVIGLLAVVVGIIFIIRGGRAREPAVVGQGRESDDLIEETSGIRVLVAVAACIVYAGVLPKLGFFISTTVLLCLLMAISARQRHRPLLIATVALLVPIVTYLLFVTVLGVRIPAFP